MLQNTKQKIFILAILSILFLLLIDQSYWWSTSAEEKFAWHDSLNEIQNEQDLKPFSTDGCSMWPNKVLYNDWTQPCITHDITYWSGGTKADRKAADQFLKEEINQILPSMGSLMYLGVRIGGHPCIPAPWRWGYGQSYLKSCLGYQ